MSLPTRPVTLTVEQIAELNKKLTQMRHDVNNHIQGIFACVEIARMKPDVADQKMAALLERAKSIPEVTKKFTSEFQEALGFPPSNL